MSSIAKLVSYLFPEFCQLCGNPLKSRESLYCKSCAESLPRIKFYCRRCGEPFSQDLPSLLGEENLLGCQRCQREKVYLDYTFLGFFYTEPISSLIERAKFAEDYVLGYKLGQLLRMVLPEIPKPYDLACAVPLSKERLRSRGYNQAELILWGYLGQRPKAKVLRKIKHTSPQTELDRKARLLNVNGAFAVEGKVEGLRVLLFDDVMTTGATLRECGKTLKKAGAKEVIALALARTQLFT